MLTEEETIEILKKTNSLLEGHFILIIRFKKRKILTVCTINDVS